MLDEASAALTPAQDAISFAIAASGAVGLILPEAPVRVKVVTEITFPDRTGVKNAWSGGGSANAATQAHIERLRAAQAHRVECNRLAEVSVKAKRDEKARKFSAAAKARARKLAVDTFRERTVPSTTTPARPSASTQT